MFLYYHMKLMLLSDKFQLRITLKKFIDLIILPKQYVIN